MRIIETDASVPKAAAVIECQVCAHFAEEAWKVGPIVNISSADDALGQFPGCSIEHVHRAREGCVSEAHEQPRVCTTLTGAGPVAAGRAGAASLAPAVDQVPARDLSLGGTASNSCDVKWTASHVSCQLLMCLQWCRRGFACPNAVAWCSYRCHRSSCGST